MKLRKLVLAGGIAVGLLSGPLAGSALAHSADLDGSCPVRSYKLTATDDSKNPKVETITGPVTGLSVGQSLANVDPVFTATGGFSIKVRWATTVGGSNYVGGNSDTVNDSDFDSGDCVGPQGPAGQDGQDGTDGVDGADGIDGEDGEDGVDGLAGLNGSDGTDGEDGIDGVDGINGTDGEDGSDGADGPQGPAGPAGPQGEQGPAGKDGKDVDSAIVTELNNRLFILEHTVPDYSFLTCDMLGGKDFAPPAQLAHLDADNDGIACETAAPEAAPTPPLTGELPKTGAGTVLIWTAALLVALGALMFGLRRAVANR